MNYLRFHQLTVLYFFRGQLFFRINVQCGISGHVTIFFKKETNCVSLCAGLLSKVIQVQGWGDHRRSMSEVKSLCSSSQTLHPGVEGLQMGGRHLSAICKKVRQGLAVALCVWCGQANFLVKDRLYRVQPSTGGHSLGVPFLGSPANFYLQFLIHNILRCSNLFFPLEWILDGRVLRKNRMRIVCGSILGQSPSMMRKRRFLW